MFALIQRFAAICLFRAGPQDLPASRFLLWVVLLVYVVLNVALLSLAYGVGQAVLQALIGTLSLVVFTWILLWRRFATRMTQTLTALAGIDILFDLMFWPLLTDAMPDNVRMLMTLGLLFWSLLVIGHVLGRALQWPLAAGFVLALCYDIISYYLSALLFPPG